MAVLYCRSKQVSDPSFSQLLTDLDEIWQGLFDADITPVGSARPWSVHGPLKVLVFWNIFNVQSSVIFNGSPRSRRVAESAVVKHYWNSKRRWTQCQKMAEFPVSCKGIKIKNYCKTMASMESVYIEGVRFGGLNLTGVNNIKEEPQTRKNLRDCFLTASTPKVRSSNSFHPSRPA